MWFPLLISVSLIFPFKSISLFTITEFEYSSLPKKLFFSFLNLFSNNTKDFLLKRDFLYEIFIFS